MEKNRFGWRGLLVIASLVGPVACGEDEDTEGGGDGSADGSADGDADGSADGDADGDDAEPQNIVETAVAAGTFNTLAQALVDTGLDEALAGPGPFTVFAPTDAAFEALGAGTLEGLTNEQLTQILQYHVVSGSVESGDLEAGPVATLSGFSAFVKLDDGVQINDASVTSADVAASNGVIHVIDKVLLPPNLVQAATYAGSFSTLLSAATQAGLADALSNPEAELTVFAPTDEAFAALPAGTLEGLSDEELADILSYHVVEGEVLSSELSSGDVPTLLGENVAVVVGSSGVTVNGENVVIADIVTTNGVIHVIDAVLIPPTE